MMQDRVVFDPLGDRVLIMPDPTEEVSEGGIYIPNMAKERPTMGTVVATGPGKWVKETQSMHPVGVGVGDRVLFGKYAGTDIDLNGESFVITSEADIMGIARKVVDRGLDDEAVMALQEDSDAEAISAG